MKRLVPALAYRTKAHVYVISTDGDIVIAADNKVGIYPHDRSKKKKTKHNM